jgi:hypothetical protein
MCLAHTYHGDEKKKTNYLFYIFVMNECRYVLFSPTWTEPSGLDILQMKSLQFIYKLEKLGCFKYIFSKHFYERVQGEPLWLSGKVVKNEKINEIERTQVRSPPRATSFKKMKGFKFLSFQLALCKL